MPRQRVKKTKQRADGRYLKTLTVGRTPDGKQIKKFFYGETEAEAIALRNEYMQTVADDAPDTDINLRQWAERWLPAYNGDVAASTYANRERAVKKIVGFVDDGVALGDVPIVEVKPSQIQALMTSEGGHCKSQISLIRCTLVNMFESAIDEGLITESPYKRIRSPKAGRYVGHRDLSPDEQAIIGRASAVHRVGMWAVLMMYAGLRRGEMASLLWSDIYDDTIHVRRSSMLNHKTKETKSEAGERDIPIVPPIQDAIDRVPVSKRHGLVCTAAGGEALTKTSYNQGWNSFMIVCLRAANGIEPIEDSQGWRVDRARANCEAKQCKFKEFDCTAHDLRYTYATMLYDAGVDVKTAAYLLGHSDVMVTMRIYTQLSERKKAMSFDKLHEFFTPKV